MTSTIVRDYRALTVRQPWAGAIAHGSKRTENRTWGAPPTHIGTRILIHAAAAEDRTPRPGSEVPDELTNGMRLWPVTRSAIVAVATLAGCHFDGNGCSENCATWGQRQVFHWQLTDVTPPFRPVPAKGAPGFWTPDPNVLAAVQQQLNTAGSLA